MFVSYHEQGRNFPSTDREALAVHIYPHTLFKLLLPNPTSTKRLDRENVSQLNGGKNILQPGLHITLPISRLHISFAVLCSMHCRRCGACTSEPFRNCDRLAHAVQPFILAAPQSTEQPHFATVGRSFTVCKSNGSYSFIETARLRHYRHRPLYRQGLREYGVPHAPQFLASAFVIEAEILRGGHACPASHCPHQSRCVEVSSLELRHDNNRSILALDASVSTKDQSTIIDVFSVTA